MLSIQVLSGARHVRSAFCSRNFGLAAPALQKVADPIQQLFLDKIREYKTKLGKGTFVDATPEIERELKQELDKVAKQFGGGEGVDMTKFPTFQFKDPVIDSIELGQTQQQQAK